MPSSDATREAQEMLRAHCATSTIRHSPPRLSCLPPPAPRPPCRPAPRPALPVSLALLHHTEGEAAGRRRASQGTGMGPPVPSRPFPSLASWAADPTQRPPGDSAAPCALPLHPGAPRNGPLCPARACTKRGVRDESGPAGRRPGAFSSLPACTSSSGAAREGVLPTLAGVRRCKGVQAAPPRAAGAPACGAGCPRAQGPQHGLSEAEGDHLRHAQQAPGPKATLKSMCTSSPVPRRSHRMLSRWRPQAPARAHPRSPRPGYPRTASACPTTPHCCRWHTTARGPSRVAGHSLHHGRQRRLLHRGQPRGGRRRGGAQPGAGGPAPAAGTPRGRARPGAGVGRAQGDPSCWCCLRLPG